ncbi:MAG: efflux RND transporter periplasmic adaptor subunit [Planctomycetes bacterium]|nr:efflux RND transporter periplasmic adaptor subunit [Planctomycetota bacterium]
MNPTLVERSDVDMNPLRLKHAVDKEQVEKVPAAGSPPPRRRRWPMIVLAVAVACGGGAWYAHAWLGAAGNSKAALGFVSKDGAGMNDVAAPAARIATAPVEVVPRSDILRLTGSLAADERSSVASNTSGIVAEVRVDRGSRVRKGDVLVQIDPTDAKNELAEGQAMLDELKARLGLDGNVEDFNPEDQPEVRLAKASADLAAANLRRAKELIAKKVISNEVYDQTETEFELANQRYRQALLLIKQAYAACNTAMAKLSILEKAVADTTIRAPFDGWVAEKLVAVGEQISSGMQATEVVTLVRIDPLRLLLTVPQQDIGCIQPGQKVRFHVDSFPDRTFEATVRFIAPVVNDTRSMVVEAVAPNPNGMLCPGLFATAELELKQQQPGIYAPVSAVQKNGEVGRVFVVRNGVAREQVVALGEQTGGKIEIRSGLTGKELLVAQPGLVKDGDKVGP